MDKTMAGLIKFILWFVVIGIVVWLFSIAVGVGFLKGVLDKSKEELQIVTEQTNQQNTTDSSSKKNSDTLTKNASDSYELTLKDGYYNKFEEINKKVERINKEGSNSTSELAKKSEKVYKLWDDELNLIYNNLKDTLPSNEFKLLQKNQIKWIEYKENLAKETYNSYAETEKANAEKYNLLTSLTEEKCKELVNEYV